MEVTPEYDARTKAELLRSGKKSDLILYCRGHAFKLHCSIVCAQSEVLGNIDDSDLTWLNRISTPFEMYLSGENFDVVKAVVDYLYTSDYDDNTHDPPSDKEEIQATPFPRPNETLCRQLYFNSRIYSFARRYKISTLPEFALGKFLFVADQFPNLGPGGRYLPSKTFLHDVMDAYWPIERIMDEKDSKVHSSLKHVVRSLGKNQRFEEWHTEVSSARETSDSTLEVILSKMPEILRKGRERAKALAEK